MIKYDYVELDETDLRKDLPDDIEDLDETYFRIPLDVFKKAAMVVFISSNGKTVTLKDRYGRN